MDEFIKAYLQAALWSSNNENEDGSAYSIENIAEESVAEAIKDCNLFRQKAGDLLDEYEDSDCGHDFWLTRNGHGAGFWDGDYEQGDGEKLTSLSKEFKDLSVYLGDDGLIYME